MQNQFLQRPYGSLPILGLGLFPRTSNIPFPGSIWISPNIFNDPITKRLLNIIFKMPPVGLNQFELFWVLGFIISGVCIVCAHSGSNDKKLFGNDPYLVEICLHSI